MTKRPMINLMTAAGALLIAGTAFAADRHADRFKELDANNDGVVVYEEMIAKARAKFTEFDKNGDGFIDLAELPKEMPMPEHMQDRMDKRMDKMKERMEKRAERRGEDADDDEMAEHMAERMAEHGKMTRVKFVARHDRDNDERVSFEEFAEMPITMFKRMDADGDGKVTKAEADEAHKRHQGKKGEGHHSSRH